jgi:transcriptional regulator with XRE-family HTH domain
MGIRRLELSLDEVRFGSVVRNLRSERGWSQERLAEHADLNRTYLGEIERGLAIPSLVSASKIASAFGLRLSVLIASCEESVRREA